MADLKRWFKVWTTILEDPHFQELSLEDIGRWVLLGAMTASVGSAGRLEVPGSGRRLCEALRVPDLEAVKTMIQRLPSVVIEEGTNRNGGPSVTWQNWTHFQEDSTRAERAKASRSKRRGEEKRGEKKRIPPPSSPPVTFHIPARIEEALKRSPRLGAVPRLLTPDFWQAQVRANAGVNFGEEILKAEAWLAANPTRAPKKDLARFLHTWLSRAERPPETEE